MLFHLGIGQEIRQIGLREWRKLWGLISFWMPAPGFLSADVIHFAATEGIRMSKPVEIVVQIIPKQYEKDVKRGTRKK
jgi:hypothetical protein